jgi:hypothetical protein
MSKIEATIRNIGDIIGWESDNVTVGPIAAAAKKSLLRLIPHIMPADSGQTSLYRLVLEHGDFGIHNMSITIDANGQPLVTSLYDWETGCIVPAILSDPLMAVIVDLVTDENAAPSFIRVPDNATPDDRVQYMTWARQYFMVRPSSFSVHEQRSNCLSPRRLSSIKRPITNVQSRQGKTHATFGLRCESGVVTIRRDISVTWELGLRGG